MVGPCLKLERGTGTALDTQPAGGDPTEQQLVERAVAGDRDAFEALYRRNAAIVFAFLRARTDFHHAEDLVAETFCRAFQRIDRFEWRGVPFRAWLLRIAHNLAVGRARAKSAGEVPLAEPRDSAVQGPEDEVVDRLAASDVQLWMSQLPTTHRTVLDLRFVREFSVSEAAVVLGLSEEAVRALTYRALKGLARLRARALDAPTDDVT